MKLYYAPGTCSLGIHVILEEVGSPFELARLSLQSGDHKKPDFTAVNPKSKVPTLQRDDGSVLTEWPAIAYWLAATNPGAGLWPGDPAEQTRALEAMDFIVGTLHGHAFSRLFNQGKYAPSEADHPKVIEQGRAMVAAAYAEIERKWEGDPWLLASGYSVADAALFYVTLWARKFGVDLPPKVAKHWEAMLARPAVQRAMKTEGLAA
ncbi:glutathione S-transferase family protein [Pseudoroseomonas globiformis]|uniref:Glutathione S-transferase family protein n=1 Tax=Teichococcus globiformis TaxID=2307229 RepID=A0ABV7G630_9PROT